MNDPYDTEATNAVYTDLNTALDDVYFSIYTPGDGTNQKIISIMNKSFDSIIIITMFLAFFSLSASMSANLYEQTKEIGVLRAIGLKKSRIKCLYFEEALIVVFASCTLGVCIEMLVGYTMVL